MKTTLHATLALLAISSLGHAQGDLDPPPGAPAPNMKSLQELWDKIAAVESDVAAVQSDIDAVQTDINDVETDLSGIQTDVNGIETDIGAVQAGVDGLPLETRTPITSLPITISSPGSYYLPGHLHFTNTTGNAITIGTANVTIDLNGFTISSGSTVTGSAISLTAISSHRTLRIMNGSITGTTTIDNVGTTWDVSPGGFLSAIIFSGSFTRFDISNLTVSRCRSNGILAGRNASVRDCHSYQNGGDGFICNNGALLQGCIASENGGEGFDLNVGAASHCTAIANKAAGFGMNSSNVSHCLANGNGEEGFTATGTSVLAFSSALVNDGIEIDATASVARTGNSPTP